MTQTLWLAWAKIAESHAASARRARESSAEDRYFVEFCDGVVTITAVAMSCEALQRRLCDVAPVAAPTPLKGRKKARAIDFLKEALHSALDLAAADVDALVSALEPYYEKRNAVAHFKEVARTPKPHPAGGHTSVETVEFRVEEAENAVSAMHALYAALRDHPSAAFLDWSTANAHAFPAGV
ncbi:MAG: hypothetical protein ACRDV1_02775 [Actinomycetes bacterium]